MNTTEPYQAGLRDPRDDPAHAPWGWREILLVLLAALVILGVVEVTAALVIHLLDVPTTNTDDDPVGGPILIMAQVLVDIGVVAAAALFSIRKFHLSPRAWGLRRDRPINIFAAAGVLFACFAALAVYLVVVEAFNLDNLKPENNIPSGLFDNRSVVPFTILLVIVVAPLCEEMVFRGFLFNGLRRGLGTIGAAAVSGLAFAAIHVTGSSFIGLLVPFAVIGFMFAMLVARTGSLWNSILVHLTFNLINVLGHFSSGTVWR
jgi:membrane protease YdiL (CAAX protease family)